MADIPDHLLPGNQPASSVQVEADPTARPPVPRTLLLWLTYGVAGTVLFPIIYLIEAMMPGGKPSARSPTVQVDGYSNSILSSEG